MSAIKDNHVNLLIELLGATGRQDKKAFSRLYRLTSPKLYAVALRILKNEANAQDCLQEAFVSVWRQAGSYRPERSAPMTWLTTIIRNRAIDILRKQPLDALSMEVEARLADMVERPDSSIDRMSIDKCLAELNPQQRDCVLQAYYEGLTHPELAEYMQLPLGTVKTWIRRALQQLRRCLQQ
ncbi:MAG: sigma-70 family RNA polymerase sigma factor [Thioalkalispiraceae bacterium]